MKLVTIQYLRTHNYACPSGVNSYPKCNSCNNFLTLNKHESKIVSSWIAKISMCTASYRPIRLSLTTRAAIWCTTILTTYQKVVIGVNLDINSRRTFLQSY